MADAYTYELWPTSSPDDLQAIIRAVYKQVLGNPHVMESERLVTAESQLCDGSISVREFVRAVAKSDFYKSRYFESCAPYRFVELNFQHILGRAPQSQAEVSEHIRCCNEAGYDAEIDSYVDSDEYQESFGENIVPFTREKSEAGRKQVVYNRNFAVNRGPAQVSSAVTKSQLVYAVATNSANKISTAEASAGSVTEKRFKIKTTGAKFDSPRRVSFNEYIVSATKMTPQIQRIQRSGAKIVSITEIK
ncbi:MAG: phycobilisome rod-core linker polypeptide [Cyanobacteria bacterium J06627_28]